MKKFKSISILVVAIISMILNTDFIYASSVSSIPPSPSTIGLIRITEYMYNGGGTAGVGEYVEFTNVGGSTVDMTGWSFDDNSRLPGSQSLTGFGIVQPGESVILTELAASTFRTNWNLCAGIKIIGGCTNNLGREDEINLYDATNTLIDRLTYGDVTFSPGSIRATLKSGYVSAGGIGNNAITQWTLSANADVESSFLSSLNEIGSPGKCTRSTILFNPCVIQTNAPTIQLNVNTTSNYIDGGILIPPVSPFGSSGVIGDLTDPLSTLGINFLMFDDLTPVNNLTVVVNSSNQLVVPQSNLIITTIDSNINVKINPIATGYSNISISVSDGVNTSLYVINYAASDASPIILANHVAWHTGMSDGSDGIPLDNDYYISGDDELDILNVYSRTISGLPFVSYDYSSYLALPDPAKPEVDVEGATKSVSIANRMYWTGSMSNGKLPYDNKPNRDRLFATNVTGTGGSATFSFAGYVNIRTALLAWGDLNGYNFTASAAPGVNSKAIAGFSLEGMVFGPDNTTLFLGLRAPLVPTSFRTNAVIAPILNFESWFNNGNPSGAPTFGNPIELNLDNRGIRDIIRLSNGTYIIVAGSPVDDGGVNNLYKWTGNSNDAPIEIVNTAGGILNMEGVMQVNNSLGQLSTTELQIISDGGSIIPYGDSNQAKDFSDLKLRKFRSDVITGLNLDICSNFVAAISPSGSTAICSGNSITLNATAGANNTYLWSTGATTPSISVSSFQSYSVTITDLVRNCSATSSSITISNVLPADFNNDHITNNIDFLSLLGLFNQACSTCNEDINKDGVVNNADFLILLAQFNLTCN